MQAIKTKVVPHWRRRSEVMECASPIKRNVELSRSVAGEYFKWWKSASSHCQIGMRETNLPFTPQKRWVFAQRWASNTEFVSRCVGGSRW
jgi:hypothetical protein